MKQENKDNAASAPISFGPADVKAEMFKLVKELEMPIGKDASCSSEQYGAILFMSLANLGVIPKENLGACMQAWDAYPKSPSAFRQVLEKADEKSTSPAVSSILAKLMKGKTE